MCCVLNGHKHEVKLMIGSRTARGFLQTETTIFMNYFPTVEVNLDQNCAISAGEYHVLHDVPYSG